MSTPTTQLTILNLPNNTTIEDPSSEAGKAWKATLEIIAAQPGHRHIYWGRRIEDISFVHLYIDRSDISAHQTIQDSSTSNPFHGGLSGLLAKPPTTHHAQLAPHPLTTIFSKQTSPVTELVTFYLPAPLSPTSQSAFDSTIAAFSARLAAKAEGSTDMASGWIVEELDHAKIGKARAYLAAYGWTSVEAHMKYRETEDFKEMITEVREKVGAAEMYHVVFTEVKALGGEKDV